MVDFQKKGKKVSESVIEKRWNLRVLFFFVVGFFFLNISLQYIKV